MTTWWRSAICASAALVAALAACASAVAKAPACDKASATTALRQAATALNARDARLLARTFERLPAGIARTGPASAALHIARAKGDFGTITELNFQPGKTTAKALAVDLARIAALGRWKLDDVELGVRRPGVVGISGDFLVVRTHSTLHYYGEGGFDCRTQRIFAFAPLRQ
jgi:hypothetical protein